MFSEINHPEMYWWAFDGPNWIFEPASSWVINTSLAKEVGYWNPPDEICFTPVMDWLQRCLLKQAQVSFSDEVTCLKFNLHVPNKESSFSYGTEGLCFKEVKALLEYDCFAVRQMIEEDMNTYQEFDLTNRESGLNVDEELIKKNFQAYLSGEKKLNPRSKRAEILRNAAIKTIKQRTSEDFEKFISVNELLKKMEY